MFRVFYTNFGYWAEQSFPTEEAAVAHGKKAGFEFSVWYGSGTIVRTWSPIGGGRQYLGDPDVEFD
jgi:hypothetical protein